MYFLQKYRRGIYNKYRKGMPLTEMLLKDLSHWWRKWRFYVRNGGKHRTIFCYPHYPSRGSTLYRSSTVLGYTITNKKPAKIDAAIYWEYLTVREEYTLLEELAKEQKVMNLYSRDISKVFVDKAFEKVFGYGVTIDPLTYEGKCLKKNNQNAIHDGVVIDCPIAAVETGYVYQYLINNLVDPRTVMDIRVPVLNYEVLPYVYRKYKPIEHRFDNPTRHTELLPTLDVFSEAEVAKIVEFCQYIQLEFAELDILRDWDSGRIYIVDANNTPQSPPPKTPKKDGKYAIEEVARRFEEVFIK